MGAGENRSMFGNVPRAVQVLRHRFGWTQTTLGQRAAVSRQIVSRTERADFGGITIASLDRVATALGATLYVGLRWRGEQLDRLIDARHAAIQQSVASWLTDLGWQVRIEVSFSRYGDRGRVDIVAFHASQRILVIVEIKSGLGDLQETLGRLDVKTRLGTVIASDLGWTEVTAVVPALVVGDSRAARHAIADHSAMFARFAVRGRRAVAWLRRPRAPTPTGLLWFMSRPDSRRVSTARSRAGTRRPRAHVA